jgi:DNA polymerase
VADSGSPSPRDLVRGLRKGLEAELDAGWNWIPWDGAPPAERLERPATPSAPAAAPRRRVSGKDLDMKDRQRNLAAIAREVAACTACRLCEQRTHTVPGEGAVDAPVLFVGEGPGQQEDETGRPFVGRAGQLLRKLIQEQMEMDPSEVFIANIVKCRPPGNRAPQVDESAACLPFLRRQVAVLRPRVIVTLGNPSTQGLLQTKTGITKMRGRPVVKGDFTFFPTFHPSYLLRNQSALPTGEEDFRAIAALLRDA